MTTFKSIAGGALWALVTAGFFFAAFEPVAVPAHRDRIIAAS